MYSRECYALVLKKNIVLIFVMDMTIETYQVVVIRFVEKERNAFKEALIDKVWKKDDSDKLMDYLFDSLVQNE